MTTAELSHHGVKGMKWGTRKDVGHEGQPVKTKKLARLDYKWSKQFDGVNGFIKMNNAVAERMNGPNGALAKINNKPEYKHANLNEPKNKKLQDKYHKELGDVTLGVFKDAAKTFGVSPSGNYGIGVVREGNAVAFSMDTLKHADFDPGAGPLFTGQVDGKGFISSIDLIEEEADPFIQQMDDAAEFFAHYGVKGMKWGQRKGEITVGRKAGVVKEAHSEEAQKLGGIHTRAKAQKSTKMLTNKELQDAIKRMQLEQQYSQLSGQIDKTATQKAKAFVTGMVQTSGKQGSQQLANEKAKKQFEKAFEWAVKKGVGA